MTDLLSKLTERRANVWEQAKEHLDSVDDKTWNGEADSKWEALNTDLSTLDERIAELADVERRNKAADEVREEFAGTGITPPQKRGDAGPSAGEILRQIAIGERREHTFVDEARDLSTLSAGAGGNLVPTTFYRKLYEHQVAAGTIRKTNVNVMRTTTGEKILVPKTTGYSTASIVAQLDPIGESDPAFGQAELDAYKYGFLVDVSSELLEDEAIGDLEGFLARQGGAAIGRGTSAHYMVGSGTGQPNGVVTAASVGVTGGTGVAGAFTADNLIDLQYSVLEEYAVNGSWMLNRTSIARARKLKDSDGQYIWQPGLQAGEPAQLLDRPVFSDPNIANVGLNARSVIFGDLSTYTIRDVNGVKVARSGDFKFGNDIVTFRFLFRTDGELIDTTGSVKAFVGAAS